MIKNSSLVLLILLSLINIDNEKLFTISIVNKNQNEMTFAISSKQSLLTTINLNYEFYEERIISDKMFYKTITADEMIYGVYNIQLICNNKLYEANIYKSRVGEILSSNNYYYIDFTIKSNSINIIDEESRYFSIIDQNNINFSNYIQINKFNLLISNLENYHLLGKLFLFLPSTFFPYIPYESYYYSFDIIYDIKDGVNNLKLLKPLYYQIGTLNISLEAQSDYYETLNIYFPLKIESISFSGMILLLNSECQFCYYFDCYFHQSNTFISFEKI